MDQLPSDVKERISLAIDAVNIRAKPRRSRIVAEFHVSLEKVYSRVTGVTAVLTVVGPKSLDDGRRQGLNATLAYQEVGFGALGPWGSARR